MPACRSRSTPSGAWPRLLQPDRVQWVTDRLGAQGTVCAGGRYDGLVGQLGGKAAPACGFAMGVERLIALIRTAAANRQSVGPTSMSCTPARLRRGWPSVWPKACATMALTSCCTVAAVRSSRK